VPTPYAESIDPQQVQASIPATITNGGIAPGPSQGGSTLPEWALAGTLVFAVVAGACFFLFLILILNFFYLRCWRLRG
jgi:hypothetical protein